MPDRPKDRVLTVDDRDYILDGASVSELFIDGGIYECGEAHDLHLDPEGLWECDEVARLLRAVKGLRIGDMTTVIDQTDAPAEVEDGQ